MKEKLKDIQKQTLLRFILEVADLIGKIDRVVLGIGLEDKKSVIKILYYNGDENRGRLSKNYLGKLLIDWNDAVQYLQGFMHKEDEIDDSTNNKKIGYMALDEVEKEYVQEIDNIFKGIYKTARKLDKETAKDMQMVIKQLVRMDKKAARRLAVSTQLTTKVGTLARLIYDDLFEMIEAAGEKEYKDIIVKRLKRLL